jgi:FMN phosphatase YigB (HAD superfamily)
VGSTGREINSLIQNTMSDKVLITDLDDTLYSWVDYWSPCFRAMIHTLSREIKIEEELLINDFKNLYSKHKSLEYVQTVQELETIKDFPESEKRRLVELAHTVFGRSARRNLKLYENVKETIRWISVFKIKTIGITNAPLITAMGRLRNLGLSKLFYGLGAFEGYQILPFETSNKFLQKGLKTKSERIEKSKYKVLAFSESEIKPSPKGYLKILEDLKIAPQDAFVVGDSLYKDIAPASELGMTTIHITYKENFPVKSKNLETLYEVTHWSKDKIEKVYDENSIKPDYVINNYQQLIDILGIPPIPPQPIQQELFADL